jgi:hypothetical protein
MQRLSVAQATAGVVETASNATRPHDSTQVATVVSHMQLTSAEHEAAPGYAARHEVEHCGTVFDVPGKPGVKMAQRWSLFAPQALSA